MSKYLLSWMAQTQVGFSFGTMEVDITADMTPKVLQEVRDYVRKEVGRPDATIMAFSKFDE